MQGRFSVFYRCHCGLYECVLLRMEIENTYCCVYLQQRTTLYFIYLIKGGFFLCISCHRELCINMYCSVYRCVGVCIIAVYM